MSVPFNVKLQGGSPGKLADPLTVTATVVLLVSTPDALPEIVSTSAQSAEKVPSIVVAVWLVTAHWKLPHAEMFGIVTACDVHTPTIGPPPPEPDPPPDPLPLLPELLLFEPLGPRTVCCSNPQATPRSVVTSNVARRLFFVIASLRQPPCGCGSALATGYKPVSENTVLCA